MGSRSEGPRRRHPGELHLRLQPPSLWVKSHHVASCAVFAEEHWQTLCPATSLALAGSQQVLAQALRLTPTRAQV